MKSKKLAGNTVSTTTQHFLDIAEIKDDCVVLRDGTLRAVLLVSSINFSLKSEDEQNAIISAYVSLLNALDFPLQIVIQSRQLDITNYLNQLKKTEKEQTNELLRMQTAEYRQYVGELIKLGDIMTKRFYVIVPYDPTSDTQKSWLRRLSEVFRAADDIRINQEQFLKRRRALSQRVEHVVSYLNSMSLKTALLDTQSLIELYYASYNPDMARRQKLADTEALRVEA